MKEQLVATCWTSAGSANPWRQDDRSPVDIAERLQMIHEAGFAGLGLRHGDLMHIDQTVGWTDLAKQIRSFRFSTLEVEFLEGWFEDGPERAASDRVRTDLLRAVETLSADQIKVGPRMAGGDLNADRMAEEFALLCQQAADVGARVGLEPMPFSNVPDPGVALDIVERAEHSAGGIFIDSWHVSRGKYSLRSLAEIPVQRIVGVELADAPAVVVGTLIEDTLNNRVAPGDGSFDLVGFIAAIRNTGYSGPWGVEIIAEEFRQIPVRTALSRAYSGAVSLLG